MTQYTSLRDRGLGSQSGCISLAVGLSCFLLGRSPASPSTAATSAASRQAEVRRATWDEFDLAAAVWTVPAAHMKRGRAHRVPLSTGALGGAGRGPRAVRRRAGLPRPGRRGTGQVDGGEGAREG